MAGDDLYWLVGDDDTQVWSTRRGEWVPASDPTYLRWLETDKVAGHVDSLDELADDLHTRGLPYPVVLPAHVVAERERRLSLGFEYPFGDARGVHRIATTEDDMKKWREVTDAAGAAINLGFPNTEIGISTETGDVVVTAMEWQAILLAATRFRQPIYVGSFKLQAKSPIPLDFTDDSYWGDDE